TATARGAFQKLGRDGETPFSRTEKHPCGCDSAFLQNLTHATRILLLRCNRPMLEVRRRYRVRSNPALET
ncbi:MAG: hypothetical protein ACLP7P_19800, partial [Rhodomicrobium sp.]